MEHDWENQLKDTNTNGACTAQPSFALLIHKGPPIQLTASWQKNISWLQPVVSQLLSFKFTTLAILAKLICSSIMSTGMTTGMPCSR